LKRLVGLLVAAALICAWSQKNRFASPAEESRDSRDSPLNPPYHFEKDGTVTDCKAVLGAVRWKYCVTTTTGSSSHTILYFLHGHGHDAEGWINSGDYKKRVREAWTAARGQAPIVVTVSFGRFWLLVEKNRSRRSGLLDVFADEVMPAVEKNLPRDGKPRRLLLGESMGGFNAAQLVMKYPRFFDRAVLACPALARLSPYAGRAEIAAYKAAPGVNGLKVWLMLRLSREVFKNESDYHKSDPFTIGQSLLGPGTPPLLVSCGDRDQYGLYKSVGEFVGLARKNGVNVTYTPLHGGHCSADPAAIAKFLLP
jgi:enterochelin esterase-like enzyme